MLREREEAAAEKERRETIEAFVEWLRDPSEQHRQTIYQEVDHFSASKPITVTAIQDIVERETPLLVQEYDTVHRDDRDCLNHLWQLWEENDRRVVRLVWL